MINIGTLLATLQLRDRLTPGLVKAQQSLKNAHQRMGAFGRQTMATGRSLTTGLTVPLLAMGAAVGVAFGGFEANMNRVKALTGETGKAFDELTALAKELGKTTKFSASEAADAMGFLAMAGFKAEEIIATLPGVLELAASANLDLASAADITTNILTGYGRTVEEVGATNDILVKAFTSANTDLVQLGQAFKFVGPVAKGAGVAFEEATAMLALMGNAGIQASMAGTGLRGALVRLLTPTKKVGDALRQNGIITKDSAGELLPMADIIQQLGDRSVSTADMMTIFGMRAGPAMVGLVSQGHEAIRKLTGELENAGGVASRVARIQMEGLNGAFIRFKSAAEGSLISVGEQLAPLFIDILEKGIKFSNWISNTLVPAFTALSPTTQKIIIGLVAFTAALGPLLIGLGALAIAVGAISLPVLGIVAAVGAVVAIFAKWHEEIVGFARSFPSAFFNQLKWQFGFLSFEELKAARAARQLNEDLGDVTPTAESLRNALGVAGVEGTVDDLHQAMVNLSGVTGGLAEDEMTLIATRARALEEDGKDLTHELTNIMEGMERVEAEALALATAEEAAAAKTTALAQATEELNTRMAEQLKVLQEGAIPAAKEAMKLYAAFGSDMGKYTKGELADFNAALSAGMEKLTATGQAVPTEMFNAWVESKDRLGLKQLNGELDNFTDRLAPLIARPHPLWVTQAFSDAGREAQENETKIVSFADKIKAKFTDLWSGMTGGSGISGLFENLGDSIIDGFGNILSGGLSSVVSMATSMAVEGAKKIWGSVKGLFGGPGEAELAGRELVRTFEDTVIASLSQVQLAEAGGERWKQVVVGVREAYLQVGLSAEEADAQVERLWAAARQGPEAVQALQDEISVVLEQAAAMKTLTADTITGLADLAEQGRTTGSLLPAHLAPYLETLQELGLLTQNDEALLMDMANQADVDWKAMESAADRYGVSLTELGPAFDSKRLSAAAQAIATDWEILNQEGVNTQAVLEGMSGKVQDLIDDAEASSVAIPASMEPIIASMVHQGLLIGKNGQALTDMGQLNFAAPLEAKFEQLIDKIDQLVNSLLNTQQELSGVKERVEAIPTHVEVDVGFRVGDVDLPEFDEVELPSRFRTSLQGGTGGQFVDWGRGTPVTLHGKERVMTAGEGAESGHVLAALEGIQHDLKSLPRHLRDALILSG